MKRQRAIPATLPTGITVTSARPVLRSSTRFNRVVPAAMSYKDLVKVVGVDPESNPLYWRKAIDHSAETVVFFQVDLRGTLPRMCKSVRICQAEENQQLLLVPSVYIGDTLLSGSYVKTIIGKRFLADEDDLMKLLEHAGILQENEELAEEKEEDRDNAQWDEDTAENELFVAEPAAKKQKQQDKREMTPNSAPTQRTKMTRSSVAGNIAKNNVASSALGSGRRQPIDLNALFVPDAVDAAVSSQNANASLPQEDTPMESDYDTGGLPVADEASDDLAVDFDSVLPGPSEMDGTGDPGVDNADTNEPTDSGQNRGDGSTGYKFPFQRPGTKKELLLDGFEHCEVYIESGKKRYLEWAVKNRRGTKGSYIAYLCNCLFLGANAEGMEQLDQRAKSCKDEGLKDTGMQRMFGKEFTAVIKAYADSIGLPTKGKSVIRIMNAWKTQQIARCNKQATTVHRRAKTDHKAPIHRRAKTLEEEFYGS
ncbi:uncharacterized protein LOC129585484 [Paramacrobiotus metropolitanus]|uniref:uncharacterized protein LOC129585484 n=1 Tax=Paramacrobiotus metropolitanus TaxID=2943436 RepID=UPI00244580BE|nr:uncharacterized protein LOC129585484 [Paramacrobiotus metropolitanus]